MSRCVRGCYGEYDVHMFARRKHLHHCTIKVTTSNIGTLWMQDFCSYMYRRDSLKKLRNPCWTRYAPGIRDLMKHVPRRWKRDHLMLKVATRIVVQTYNDNLKILCHCLTRVLSDDIRRYIWFKHKLDTRMV